VLGTDRDCSEQLGHPDHAGLFEAGLPAQDRSTDVDIVDLVTYTAPTG